MRTTIRRHARGFGDASLLPLIALGINTITIQTAATPPITMNLNGETDPDTDALLREVQPAVTFDGPLGNFVIAPYGVPTNISETAKIAGYALLGGVGAGILGLMLFGGAVFGRRR